VACLRNPGGARSHGRGHAKGVPFLWPTRLREDHLRPGLFLAPGGTEAAGRARRCASPSTRPTRLNCAQRSSETFHAYLLARFDANADLRGS